MKNSRRSGLWQNVGYRFVDRTMGKLGLGLKLQLKIRVTYRVRVRVRHSFVHINICILFNTMYGPQIRVHILRVENSGKNTRMSEIPSVTMKSFDRINRVSLSQLSSRRMTSNSSSSRKPAKEIPVN